MNAKAVPPHNHVNNVVYLKTKVAPRQDNRSQQAAKNRKPPAQEHPKETVYLPLNSDNGIFY